MRFVDSQARIRWEVEEDDPYRYHLVSGGIDAVLRLMDIYGEDQWWLELEGETIVVWHGDGDAAELALAEASAHVMNYALE